MLPLDNVPNVERSETLARFVLSSRHIRNSDDNANHVNVCSWPPGKAEQILKAKEIAERAKLIRAPATDPEPG